MRFPAQNLAQSGVVRVAAADALRSGHVLLRDAKPGDACHHIDQLIDADEPILTQVKRLAIVGAHQLANTGYAVVDITERPGLLTVAPDLDGGIVGKLLAMATLRQIAAGAFSRPPSHVPSGPKMLWKRTIRVSSL